MQCWLVSWFVGKALMLFSDTQTVCIHHSVCWDACCMWSVFVVECVKLAEIDFLNCNVYGEIAIRDSIVFKWKQFLNEGHENVLNNEWKRSLLNEDLVCAVEEYIFKEQMISH